MRYIHFLLWVTVVATLSSCAKDFDFPSMPGEIPGVNMGSSTDDGDAPELDYNINAFDGRLADDIANDIIGSDKDFYWEVNNFVSKVTICYSGSNATIANTNSDIVCYAEGAHVVVDMLTNSVSGVEIELSGTSTDGSLKIYGENKFKLTLNGVSLTSSRGPAINSQCKKRMFIHAVEGTENYLVDSKSYYDDIKYLNGSTADSEDRKGCMFSEGNMIFSGQGCIMVAGKMKHGIATDGYLYTRPGITLAVTEAAKNAIHAKGDADDNIGIKITGGLIYTNTSSEAGKGLKTDLVAEISGGTLDINTSGNATYDSVEKDTSSAAGIKADTGIVISGGNIYIKSTGTGGKGLNSDATIAISGGTTTVVTTGGKYTYSKSLTSSPKGVKANGDITINDGVLQISTTGVSESSEALESKSSITINDGNVYAYAYDDAINAAKDLTVNGGNVYAYAINNDGIDSNGTIHINGGLAISIGAGGIEESFDCDRSANLIITGGTALGIAGGSLTPSSASKQNCVVYNSLSCTKGKNLTIKNSDGTALITFPAPRTFSSMSLLFTSPLMDNGSYTVYNDDSKIGTFTVNSTITTVGTSSGMGGGMGGPGGWW